MFDKRLLRLVPQAKPLIALDVALQWVALMANIALFILIGFFLQRLMEGAVADTDTAGLLAAGAAVLRALAENREGKTIVLVSHRPSAAALGDTVYSIERIRRAS